MRLSGRQVVNIVTVCFVAVCVVAWLIVTAPDWGGVDRAAGLSDLPRLREFVDSAIDFERRDIMERPKFVFRIKEGKYQDLLAYLQTEGISNWERRGLAYDGLRAGMENDNDLLTSKGNNRLSLVGISKEEQRLYLIPKVR